jgi:autophagy-related protein 9
VLRQVTALHGYRVVTLAREMLAVLLTPLVLLLSLPKSSVAIIQFFRQYTVHVQGVGHVCSFCNFLELQLHGNSKYGVDVNVPKWMRTKHGKLEKSVLNFKVHHPGWQPDEQGQRLFTTLSQYMTHSVDSSVAAWYATRCFELNAV